MFNCPPAGDYLVRVWLEDAAANANRSMASVPVHLRYDPAAPGLSAPAASERVGECARGQGAAAAGRCSPTAPSFGKSGIKGYAVTY